MMNAEGAANPAAFISYAHEDRPIADAVAVGLLKRGCKIWIDEGELGAGDSLVECLADGIAEVDFVIAVISKHSAESLWCRKELSLALTQELDLGGRFGVRRVLPLRLDNVDMPRPLRDKVYLEVKRDRPGDVVPRLWEDILKHSGSSIVVQPLELVQDGAEQSYRHGKNLYDRGEMASARRHLQEAARENHHAAALLLGEILYDQGKVVEAAREWDFAAGSEEAETANAAVVNYGRMLAEHEFATDGTLRGFRGASIGGRDFREAESLWLAAAESGRRDAAWAWLGLGKLREDPWDRDVEPDLEGAEVAFEQAAQSGHSESHTYALFKLGRAKTGLGKRDEAIGVLSAGATSGDTYWRPWCALDLGSIYWQRGDAQQAAMWWLEAAKAQDSQVVDAARSALDDPNSIWRKK